MRDWSFVTEHSGADMKDVYKRQEKYHKTDVKIEIVKDPALLGGFILKTGDDEYDWSLKGRLSRLEQKLTWR